jgi:hypothetical protein
MKSIIKESEHKDESIKYPVLMRWIWPATANHLHFIVHGQVVLFSTPTHGTVVHVPTKGNGDLGSVSSGWIPAIDPRWEKFTGTIELSN